MCCLFTTFSLPTELSTFLKMPVSVSLWRLRIGTFVQWPRLENNAKRLDSLLKERERPLRRLLEEKGKRGTEPPRTRYLTMALLLALLLLIPCLHLFMSGDVEINPGPNEEASKSGHLQEGISDKIILDISESVPDGMISRLGLNLGFKLVNIKRFRQTNRIGGSVTSEGTTDMLLEWRNSTSLKQQSDTLAGALHEAGLSAVAETFLRSSFPKKAAVTTQPTAYGDSTSSSYNLISHVPQCKATEGQLEWLSKNIPAGKYHEFCHNLIRGMDFNESDQLLASYNKNYKMATRAALATWNTYGEDLADLCKAMERCQVRGLIAELKNIPSRDSTSEGK